jgi:hypothetical protein
MTPPPISNFNGWCIACIATSIFEVPRRNFVTDGFSFHMGDDAEPRPEDQIRDTHPPANRGEMSALEAREPWSQSIKATLLF